MPGFTADLGGLDSCRRAILSQAGQFGAIADRFSGRDVDASTFGTLPVAGPLAELACLVDAATSHEFGAAESFLRGVERALDDVRHGLTQAERVNVSTIRAI